MKATSLVWIGSAGAIVLGACSSSSGPKGSGGASASSSSVSSSVGSGGTSASSSGALGGSGGAGGSSTASTTSTGSGGAGGSTSASSGSGGVDDGGTDGGDAGVDDDLYVYPVGSTINGQTYAQWGTAWWEWALGIPKATNPLLNGDCTQDQPSGVFFLAGNAGGTDVRTCTVPADTPLFFPILNAFNTQCPETNCANTPAAAQAAVAQYYTTHPPLKLSLTIDGVALSGLSAYHVLTGAFDDTEGADTSKQIFPGCDGPIGANTCGVPVGSVRQDAGNGYWIMLKPLASGTHVVHFVGVQSVFSLDVTYTLTVP
jgi:hypothetical protein